MDLYIYKNLILFILFFVFILLSVAITTLVERKVMSSIQRRKGPNIVGLLGFLQPIADGIKLFLKELILPSNSNLFIFLFSPIFTFFCSILLWIIIPFDSNIILINFSFSSLYLLSISSLSVYGIIFAGWSSNSQYAFLGGLRSAAQMISYEVCIGFIFIIMILMSESFNLIDIIYSQSYIWFIIPLFPIWILFLISCLAETNRAPFDLPEAEAELVAGYNIEYSSVAFVLFFLAEYSNIVLMSTLLSIFFFGGWLGFSILNILPGSLLLGLKISMHVFIFVWIRASFPRYRYDQLMKLGWKALMPLSVSFVYVVSFILINFYLII
jgi:NADH-quinone oxidoreductase subunit H